MFSILDADSSQRRCILAAANGKSFVMDGPPGTGKSQTIANMIAELMATGKSVLFVSEKAAALDVVRDRLRGAGLGQFLFELHGAAATRKAVVQELAATLKTRASAARTFTELEAGHLVRTREELTAFAVAMNEVRTPLGMSVFQVVGRIESLSEHVDASAIAGSQRHDMTAEDLAAL
ncbi:AAA family ATPase, partial [Rhodococcus hoagii]|nr:AAA family ATPase [Prescottella equi]